MCSITDEDPVLSIESLFLEGFKFVEERRNVDNATTTDEVFARRIDESRRKDMHTVRYTSSIDSMASVVPTLSTAAPLGIGGENVTQFAFRAPSETASRAPGLEFCPDLSLHRQTDPLKAQ